MRTCLLCFGCFVGLGCGGGQSPEDVDGDDTNGAEMARAETLATTADSVDELQFGQVAIDLGQRVSFTLTEDGRIEIGGETVVRLTPAGEVRSVEGEPTTIMRLRDDGEIADLADGGVLGPRLDGHALVMPNGNRIEIDDAGAITLRDASGQSVDPSELGFRVIGVTAPTRRATLFAIAISTWLLQEIASEQSEGVTP
jgi:hypothetical protein